MLLSLPHQLQSTHTPSQVVTAIIKLKQTQLSRSRGRAVLTLPRTHLASHRAKPAHSCLTGPQSAIGNAFVPGPLGAIPLVGTPVGRRAATEPLVAVLLDLLPVGQDGAAQVVDHLVWGRVGLGLGLGLG